MKVQIIKNLYVLFGGTGFIGTNIYNRLLHDDTYFLVIDKESHMRFIDNIPEELKQHVTKYHHHLDFTNHEGYQYVETAIKNFINGTIKGEDPSNLFEWNITFVHLASTVGVEWNIAGNFRSEMRITQNIIQIIKDVLVDVNDLFKKINICYTSTSELFGENSHKIGGRLSIEQQEDLIDLTCLYSPKYSERSEYIYQKFIGEKLFKNLGTQLNEFCNNSHIFILRLFNIIGPFQDPDKGVFSKFVINIIRGKGSWCSKSVRRYVPVEVVTDFFNPYSKALFGVMPKGLTSVMFTGHEKLFCGTGEELYLYIEAYIKRKYPNCKGLQKSNYILDQGENKNGIDNPKEIMQRFEKRILTDTEFEQYYGPFIEAIIEMQIKYGPLSKSSLGIISNDREEPIKIEEEFPGEVTHYKDGLALIKGLKDYTAGNLILFENGEQGLLSDTEEIPTCVIFDKGDNIPIGLRCKLNGKLKFPK